MEIGWIMGGFFTFVTIVFIVIAVFVPELVGITGKKALQTLEEQRGDQPTDQPPSPEQKPLN